jgi:hypothetical protein
VQDQFGHETGGDQGLRRGPGLRELNVIIAAYEEFLVRVRDTDPVSHQLVTQLLADETHRRADIEAALQRP